MFMSTFQQFMVLASSGNVSLRYECLQIYGRSLARRVKIQFGNKIKEEKLTSTGILLIHFPQTTILNEHDFIFSIAHTNSYAWKYA